MYIFVTGNFEGELLLNGRPVSEEVMIKISGFVPQYDISFDQLTALEHLSLMVGINIIRKKFILYKEKYNIHSSSFNDFRFV